MCRASIYNYLTANSIPCFQIKGKTLISRESLDALFNGSHLYLHRPTKEKQPITEFYTTKEVLEKFSISNSWLFKAAKENNFPKITQRGENLNDFLEKIEWKEVKKEFLTLSEVKQLVATPCKIPVLKQAVLFSCMTGLRISDILQLSWEHIQMGQDGGYLIRLCTEKTEEETNLPISDETLALCGERSEGLVFKGLKRHMVNHPLKEWIKSAGLTRRITFHTGKHFKSSFLLKINDLQSFVA